MSSTYQVDRTNWPKGPWDNEPDRKEWRSHGLPCLIVRGQDGAWCGYVGVAKTHPFYEKPWDEIDGYGGINYSNFCSEPICHVPIDGEDHVWWLGFDCAHCRDYSPAYQPLHWLRKFATYKDIDYVINEVEKLAALLSSTRNNSHVE